MSKLHRESDFGTCSCGTAMTAAAEAKQGQCFNCQGLAAGVTALNPPAVLRTRPRLTAAEVDAYLTIPHPSHHQERISA